MTPTPDETLMQAVLAYRDNGYNKAAAARALGLPVNTLKDRLDRAAVKGMMRPGEEIGNGYALRGTSALRDSSGEITSVWIKSERQRQSGPALIEEIKGAFDGIETPPNPPRAKVLNSDLLTVYVIADHHLGMYAWAKEAGENYDTEIAAAALREAAGNLTGQTPPSGQAVILNLGDFFHADNDEAQTRRSGNHLDVDTRYGRVLHTGIQLMTEVIDMARGKHGNVFVRNLQGNHDRYAALALSEALAQRYRNDPFVHVDTDPSYHWHFPFGRTLLAATHGDMTHPNEMPQFMASTWPEEWGAAEFRYAYAGHFHTRRRGGPAEAQGEKGGAVWEVFQTLAPKDSWHAASGYVSGRSMTAITLHKELGEVQRNTWPIKRRPRGKGKR